MTDRDIDRLIEAARAVAARLDMQGDHTAADTIRRLATSRTASRETNRRLAADNRILRERLS